MRPARAGRVPRPVPTRRVAQEWRLAPGAPRVYWYGRVHKRRLERPPGGSMRPVTLLSVLAIAALTGCAFTPHVEAPRVAEGGMVPPSTRVVGVRSHLDLRTNATISRNGVPVAC